MQCHMSDTHIHKFNIKCWALIFLIGKTAMKTCCWKSQLLGESRAQDAARGTGHFFGPFSLHSALRAVQSWKFRKWVTGLSSLSGILCSHYHNATKANRNECIDSPFSVSNIESYVKYAPGAGLSTESPNSRLEIHPAENSDIITFLCLFLPVAYQVEETVNQSTKSSGIDRTNF